MTRPSTPELLVLHTLRIMGWAHPARIAVRWSLEEAEVEEHLLDAQAHGWASRSAFAGDSGWSLTEAGKSRGERLLADELDAAQPSTTQPSTTQPSTTQPSTTGARRAVTAVHRDFLPLNETATRACTDWQLREPEPSAASAPREAVLATLSEVAEGLAGLQARLSRHLRRFDGYHSRFAGAIWQATADPAWITGIDRDSAHRVWFELHEDLIATLGLRR